MRVVDSHSCVSDAARILPPCSPAAHLRARRRCFSTCSAAPQAFQRASAAAEQAAAPTQQQRQPVRVHVATVPLVGMEAAAERLGRLHPDQLALHTLVILEHSGADVHGSGCTVYDFLPLHPTSPVTASRRVGLVVSNIAQPCATFLTWIILISVS